MGQSAAMLDHSWGGQAYQLRLKPALKLLLVAPEAVSPIEPEMVTPSNSFCSAPILPSHLSSLDDSVRPAVKLVPVSVIESFADWSVSWLREGWLGTPGTGTSPCWIKL